MNNLDQNTVDEINFLDKHYDSLDDYPQRVRTIALNLADKVKELSEQQCNPIPQKLLVTINVEGLIKFLLGWEPLDDDLATVIGDSRVAYLSLEDPAHVFMPAAAWHDAAYVKGSPEQLMGMTRENADILFAVKCLHIANGNYALKCKAATLYLLVDKYAAFYWEGEQ